MKKSCLDLTTRPNSLKEEIIRAFILSLSLEPLAEKPGCTTRTIDSSLGTKLKYFIISSANSATYINRFIEDYFNNIEKQPLFKYAYEAQLFSDRNRMGGKVNYAQILMLLPIINAQCILHKNNIEIESIEFLLQKATEFLLDTNEVEVSYLQKFVDISIKQSQQHNLNIGKERLQLYPKFEGLYTNIIECTSAKDFSHTMMATEIKQGYPECLKIYKELNDINEQKDLLIKTELIYPFYLEKYKRHDVAADNIVVAIYLTLIKSKEEKLFL